MQKTFLICATMFIVLCSGNCKKNGTNPPAADQGDYQPLTAGSEWNYTTTGGASAGSYKLTVLNRDSSVNGRAFRVISNSSGGNEYYNKTGNDYYRFAKLAELNNQQFELLYLKDNIEKGQTWVETRSINVTVTGFGTVPVTAQFTFSIADKGIEHVVNGVTFKDVIRVTVVPVFTAFGSNIPVDPSSSIQYFYARKVGFINSKILLKIPLASVDSNTETKITSYTIK
jgi:hypothetical protein